MSKSCLFLFFSLIAAAALAEENAGVDLSLNKPILVTFPNGSQAQAYSSKIDTIRDLPVKVEVFESTCSPIQRTQCTYFANLVNQSLKFKWVKHSDPSKIGTKVKVKDRNRVRDLKINFFFSASMSESFPKLTKGLSQDRFVCDDYRVFGNHGTPANLTFSNWNIEGAAINAEDDLTENRILYSFLDLKMKACGNGYCVTSLGTVVRDFPLSTPMLFYADSASATMIDEKTQQSCQLGLKGDAITPISDEDDRVYRSHAEGPFVLDSEEWLVLPDENGFTLRDSLTDLFSDDHLKDIQP